MQEKMYSVAIRRRFNNKDHFWMHNDYEFIECKIDTCGGRYWYADPFIFEKHGIVYIFFEAFDLILQRGKEGYCILNEDGTCGKPKLIIDEPYHLSFPNIFEYNGDVYIMPEMSEDYSLKLYKAISFPNIWKISNVVLPDVYACDSVLIESDSKRYLLTNEMYHNVPKGQFASCYVKNFLYEVDGIKAVGNGLMVAEGDYGIRNAGKVFEEDGVLYRIGQDCRDKMYGKGLVLFMINSITPYKEEILWGMTCDDIGSHIMRENSKQLRGVHTYNFSENYEIIDFSVNNELTTKIKMMRLHNKIKIIIRRIKQYKNLYF